MKLVFNYDERDFVRQTESWDADRAVPFTLSKFDNFIRQAWDKSQQEGLFKYNVADLQSRVVPGTQGYILQLNMKRGTQRRKPQDMERIDMPYDPNKFNFTKIKDAEVICELAHTGKTDNTEGDKDLLLINISPLEYGHILLVPNMYSSLPQILTVKAAKMSLVMMLLSSHRGLRVGFNGLCAFSSVNHLHTHAWYLEHPLYTEYAPVKNICKNLYEMVDMPTRAFVIQLSGSDLDSLSKDIFSVTNHLQTNSIAHNVFFTRGVVFGEERYSNNTTIRVYIWPRKTITGSIEVVDQPFYAAVAELGGHIPCYGAKNETLVVFNVAVAELGGHIPCYDDKLYDQITEEFIEERIRDFCISDDQFERISEELKQVFSS